MKTMNFFSLAVVVCLMTTCRSSVITSLKVDLFEETLQQTLDPQLVDVRTLTEYDEGYLPGAILIDIKEPSFVSLIQQLDRTRPVFVYCRSGKRSMDAANILEKNKFKKVYNLEGGIIAWKEKGKKVIVTDTR
jgi:rhodanese-related sulfurtransferase